MFGLIGALCLGLGIGKEATYKRKAQREYNNKIALTTAQHGQYGKIHHEIFRWHGGSEGKTPYQRAVIKASDCTAMKEYPLTQEEITAVEEAYRKNMQSVDIRTKVKYRLDTGKYLEDMLGGMLKMHYAEPFMKK